MGALITHNMTRTPVYGPLPGKHYNRGDPLDMILPPHHCLDCGASAEEIIDFLLPCEVREKNYFGA